jgi:tetratricopeptide (TPR) repeat protein
MADTDPTVDPWKRTGYGRLSDELRQVLRRLLKGRIGPPPPSLEWALAADDATGAPADPERSAAAAEEAYDEVFDRVFQKVAVREAWIERERERGRELFEELMHHPPSRQCLLVSNSGRYRSRMLCEHLVEESLEAGFQDVSRAVALARLAVTIAGLLKAEDRGGESALDGLRARAWAQLGNACRVNADHPAAESAFERAEALCAAGRMDLLDRARVLDLKASLRRDQRRFAEASQLMDEVIAIYHQLGQWHLVGRSLKQKSMICGEAGDGESEIALLRCALGLLDPEEEPRTFLAARHNLILALHESGRSREAFALLFHTRPLYLKAGDRMNLLRLRWLEGSVALGLGRLDQAEVAFREVRGAYVELGLDYDAAVASLDLARVYAQQGRGDALRDLAEEMLAIFRSHSIHREAMAALLFFCQAVDMEKAEVGLIREVAGFLKRARDNPDLRFSHPA